MSLLHYLQANPTAFIILIGVLGLMVGSFLNVVIHRMPIMMERDWKTQCTELLEVEAPAPPTEPFNLVVPRSRCPHCGHGITALENIPVISYLLLRGRCSACGQRISARYPLVETLTGILSLAVAWHFGMGWQCASALLLSWSLIALGLIDFDTTLLPDGITLPFLWLGLAVNLPGLFVPLDQAVIGAIAGYASLWTVYHLFRLATGKEGMGYGDFKLLAMLGAWLGWQMLPAIILLSSIAGAIIGVGMILLRGHDRSIPIPFGPYLAIAGWLALMWGAQLNQLYQSWLMG